MRGECASEVAGRLWGVVMVRSVGLRFLCRVRSRCALESEGSGKGDQCRIGEGWLGRGRQVLKEMEVVFLRRIVLLGGNIFRGLLIWCSLGCSWVTIWARVQNVSNCDPVVRG